jgi:hypothetical protein
MMNLKNVKIIGIVSTDGIDSHIIEKEEKRRNNKHRKWRTNTQSLT